MTVSNLLVVPCVSHLPFLTPDCSHGVSHCGGSILFLDRSERHQTFLLGFHVACSLLNRKFRGKFSSRGWLGGMQVVRKLRKVPRATQKRILCLKSRFWNILWMCSSYYHPNSQPKLTWPPETGLNLVPTELITCPELLQASTASENTTCSISLERTPMNVQKLFTVQQSIYKKKTIYILLTPWGQGPCPFWSALHSSLLEKSETE